MAQKHRRIFSREYKIEAVRLIKDRGVTVAQAARDLDIHENVLRKWVKDFEAQTIDAPVLRMLRMLAAPCSAGLPITLLLGVVFTVHAALREKSDETR